MIVSWLNRAGTVSLRGLVAFGKFWYGFLIGDDWTVAAAVAAALAVTWLLHTAGVAAWWLPPLVAVAATALQGHHAGLKGEVIAAVTLANFVGSSAAVRLGRRFIRARRQ